MENTAVDKAVTLFLNSGTVRDIKDAELAKACAQHIVSVSRHSLKNALALAKRFASHGERHGGQLRFWSLRILAQVSHLSGRHREALAAYQKALPMARHEPLIRARIDRTLIDIYMYLSDFAKSRQCARRAIATFKKLRSESDLAQTKVNYANLLHRQDRHRDAKRLYRQAADYFERTDNHVATARCYYNLANTLVQLFEVDEAERLYKQALKIYIDAGFDLDACDTRYGLAWLWMLTGKFHKALLELTACEITYRESGDPRGEALCLLDRSEIFLSLGLHHDALQSSRLAEKKFSRLGLRYEAAKAALFRGQAAQALKRRDEARDAAARAGDAFGAEKNSGFLGAVHLLKADLSNGSNALRRRSLHAARACFTRSQLPLWEAVCDVRFLLDRREDTQAVRRLGHNRAAQVVPHVYALWQTTQGDVEYRKGQRDLALRSWRRAADRLDAVRAQLPPVELRSSYAKVQALPHSRLVEGELHRDIPAAAAWSERKKTAGVWSPIDRSDISEAARKKVEQSLTSLAQQFAGVARQLAGTGERGLASESLTRATGRLQRKIRQELLALEREAADTVDSVEELGRRFERLSYIMPVVQFHDMGDSMVAFVHSKGHIRVHDYADSKQVLGQAMERWRFFIEAELLADYPGSGDRLKAERTLWTELGDWLWKPLGLSTDHREVLILPEGNTANIPWPALIVDNAPLVERHHFILAPSLRHHLAATSVRVGSDLVEVFKGKSGDLPMVERELDALVAQAGSRARVFDPGTRSVWPDEGEAQVWHYSGHAELREDNPFYSYLVLEDGPLFATDFRLKRYKVHLMVLAACRSGEQIALPGEESAGLVRSSLEMGARNVIAGNWPVSDRTTALWMKDFYGMYLSGNSILDSVRHAALSIREQFPSAFHWAAFAVSGAGD